MERNPLRIGHGKNTRNTRGRDVIGKKSCSETDVPTLVNEDDADEDLQEKETYQYDINQAEAFHQVEVDVTLAKADVT